MSLPAQHSREAGKCQPRSFHDWHDVTSDGCMPREAWSVAQDSSGGRIQRVRPPVVALFIFITPQKRRIQSFEPYCLYLTCVQDFDLCNTLTEINKSY